jgi:hypothetical protein
LMGSPRLYDLGLFGARGFVASFVNQLSAAFLFSFVVISMLLFFTMLTRSRKVAVAVTWLLLYLLFRLNGGGSPAPLDLVLGLIIPTLLVIVITRYGVLALISTMFFIHLAVFYPVTTELTAWYATSFILETLVLLALTLYAFRTSLGGQRMATWLDE